MNSLAAFAATIAILAYIPISVQVWRGTLHLNAASFLLWILLDFIAAASIFVKGGNYLLPAAYVVGCTVVMIAILKSRNFKWTAVETVTALLVLISVFAWWKSGPIMATIISTASAIIAGLPQVWDIWRKPENSMLWVWLTFTFVNMLSTIAGTEWSISERLYPASFTILAVLMAVLTLRKYGSGRSAAQ